MILKKRSVRHCDRFLSREIREFNETRIQGTTIIVEHFRQLPYLSLNER